MNKMERINKKLGFGLMRLPMKDGEVDIEQTCLMVDEFIKAGFNYFDTAHGYLSGKSEKAAKTCLTSRYPRESFILTNKLTDEYFKTNDDIRPFFESQLELCGVDYFDFYLMHAQNKARFRYFKERNAYETAIELKKEGKIRHFGISFHDRAEVLDAILTSKSIYCQGQNISLTCVADGRALHFMDTIDISSLFGNAMDNAIESVRQIPEEESEKRLIHLSVVKQKGFVRIRVENYCEKEPVLKDGMPVTTKKDTRFHGYGLKSIQSTARKYGGSVTASVKNHWFELRILLPEKAE